MRTPQSQLEFLDIRRAASRPAGGGEVVDGFFVFTSHSQRVDQVAYTLGCTPEHIYHQIEQGEFPNATDISSDTAARACYRIPRADVLAYLDCRKVGAR